jgi:Na+/melibiose symporter-like transporter
MLADIAEFDRLKTSRSRSGSLFALYLLSQKASLALGSGIGFWITGAFGFSATGPNPRVAVWGMELAMVWIPAALLVAAGALAFYFPLNSHRQHVIRRAIARKDRAIAARTDTLGPHPTVIQSM